MVAIILCLQRSTVDTPIAFVYNPLSNGEGCTFTQILESAGYEVTEYTNTGATVSKLKQIPKDVDIVVLRVHSSININQVWLFTGEAYSTDKHQIDQLVDNVHKARISQEDSYCFAVGSGFIEEHIPELDGADILVLGCDAAATDELATVFISKGASSYVSWSGPVTLEHTDRVFTTLLQLVLDGSSIEDAVETVSNMHGSDPNFHSTLVCFKQMKKAQ